MQFVRVKRTLRDEGMELPRRLEIGHLEAIAKVTGYMTRYEARMQRIKNSRTIKDSKRTVTNADMKAAGIPPLKVMRLARTDLNRNFRGSRMLNSSTELALLKRRQQEYALAQEKKDEYRRARAARVKEGA